MQADSEMVKTAHCNLGIILGKQLEYQKGIEHCRQALEIDAEFAEVHGVLGGLLSDISKTDEGKKHLAEAIRLDPGNAVASCNLARILLVEGNHGRAAVLYSNALKERPRFLAALQGLATIRATSSDQTLRDGKQAVDLAAKTCELTRYEDPRALDILGMAHAQAGRFADAISAAERALWIARAAGNKALANSIEQRIRLYKQDRPFRNQHSPSRSTAPEVD
jgi:tetratricopeptide (TPR) repeat protein